MRQTIISCAVTGSAPTPEKNSAVPVTPSEIVKSAVEAAKADFFKEAKTKEQISREKVEADRQEQIKKTQDL